MSEADNVNSYVDGIWQNCVEKIVKLCKIRASDYPGQAEEILDEVYTEFSNAVKSGRLITYPEAWIYKTANNIISQKFRNLVKENKKHISYDANESILNEIAVNIDFDDVIVSDEKIEVLADEITEMLSEDEKRILELYYEDKLSMRQIAAELNKSESAVKQKHFRLVRKIKMLAKEKIENL